MRHQLFVTFTLALVCTSAFARSSDSSGVIFFGVIGLIAAYWFYSSAVNRRVERELARRQSEIEAVERRAQALTTAHSEKERAQIKAQFEETRKAIDALTTAFSINYINGRAWLAQYIAEAFQAPDIAIADALESKKHPARKAADEVRRIATEKKELLQRIKELEYTLKTYHEYYPVLEQYHEDILNESATLTLNDEDQNTDSVSRFISREEYDRLKPAERNQRALDNWKARKKSNAEIGRMYERYLGYLYETEGWAVTFFGAIQGIEDMGRDLICMKGTALHVVQAKYWAKHKTIHEKHIFQLYGAAVLIPLTRPEHRGMRVTPVFCSTTAVSETAAWAAKQLNVVVRKHDMDQDYPMIKCNVNGRSKIYHLPFDQQYDRCRIDPSKGECYVKSAVEAEKLGFRRTMKHTAHSA